MRKNVLAIIVALACVPAFATGNNNQNGPGGNATGGNATGGTAIANGGGASVLGSGNSSNLNSNTNLQGQAQGQQQGQAAIGVGIGGEGGRAMSSSSSGSSSTSGASATSNSGGNTMVGGRQDTTNNNQSGANVTVTGDTYQAQERNPVNTAYAAPLAAANGTCMGSTSGGAQGVSFGVSFGSTWVDAGCDARYDATALAYIGLKRAAQARLCLKPEIAKAMEAAGTPCPTANAPTSAAATAPVVATAKPAGCDYKGNDEVVIKRYCK